MVATPAMATMGVAAVATGRHPGRLHPMVLGHCLPQAVPAALSNGEHSAGDLLATAA